MRYNISKKHSTKSERLFYEALKHNKIDFRHRWLIDGYEVDFLIGNIIVEINGHEQDPFRNNRFIELGYVPIHFSNVDILNNRELIIDKIKELYGTYKA